MSYLLLRHFFSLSFVQTLVIVFQCNDKNKTILKTQTGMDSLSSKGLLKSTETTPEFARKVRKFEKGRVALKRSHYWSKNSMDALVIAGLGTRLKTWRTKRRGRRRYRGSMRHSNSHKFPAARRIKNIEPVANCYSQWI